MPTKPTGIILMTYGSATTSRDVEPFLRHVYPNVQQPLIDEFRRRFDIVGSSPLVEITIKQAQALQDLLNSTVGEGRYLVRAGMLHSTPFIADAMSELHTAGATTVLGVLLSPQYSPHIMRGYDKALAAAAESAGYEADQVTMLGQWSTEPKFIQMISEQLVDLRSRLTIEYGRQPPVVFTTHSLPEAVVRRDPTYLDQLTATMEAVASQVGLDPDDYEAAYQSAGHSPEPWLKPDLNDVVANLDGKNVRGVIIVPIQFLADHLEILYDLDTAARDETEALGVHYHRLPVANLNPMFIEALADIVRRAA